MILYAGSYTEMVAGDFGGHGEGIYCFEFDTRNGNLQLKHVQPTVNPSYLCIPSGKYLYSHTEVLAAKRPRVQAYEINESDYSLHLLNEQEIPGGCPCHTGFSKKYNCVLTACYETGNTFIFPVAHDGKILPHVSVLQHKGSSINPRRQERAHAHMAIAIENLNSIVVTDLGIDKIMVYQIDDCKNGIDVKLKQSVALPPGSGPRHIAFHPKTKCAFVLNELIGTVSVMHFRNGEFDLLSTVSALAVESKKMSAAAAIRVSADGKFIYTSERSDDNISILRFNNKNKILELTGRQKTFGKTPRDFILDPTGNWLLAANQDSDSITVFKVNKTTGMISPENLIEKITSPVCLEWLPTK